jgi:quinol monooxygenase YgiN
MLTVVATYRTGPGATRGVADLLARHAAASEQEAGCRPFLVHQALDDPARFFLYETYDSAEASPSTGAANISGGMSKQCARRC